MAHKFRLQIFLFALFGTSAAAAQAEDTRHIIFFSGELSQAKGYFGIGWMGALNGIDGSGPVASIEAGRQGPGQFSGKALAGWRIAFGRALATLMAGAEASATIRPAGSAEIWWDERKWMATARAQATPDYVSGRAAIGYRFAEALPWIGPEVGYDAGTWRFGAHATSVPVISGVSARVSAGGSSSGGYVELSLWRRF